VGNETGASFWQGAAVQVWLYRGHPLGTGLIRRHTVTFGCYESLLGESELAEFTFERDCQ
jgi:hypothetical protein